MCQSIKLRIRNFGPIKKGDFQIDKYTVLMGGQGTGKSTVSKVFSLFTWLEKALIRHVYTEKQIQQNSFGNKVFNRYYHIDNYYRPETVLEYDGIHYQFIYADSKLGIIQKQSQGVEVAKVMYVPAERNILSAVDKPSNMSGWPATLSSFLEEFEKSKRSLISMELPLRSNLRYEYDRLNDISWIAGADYRIHLTDAASGYQSLVPMCLVTACLSNLVAETAAGNLNVSDKLKLQKEVDEVMSNSLLSEDVKNAMLQNISERFKYSCFVNVVEELEQNLYPYSQMDVLWFLLAHCNRIETNRLLLTTHSPYIVNYLTLAVKANEIWQKMSDCKDEKLKNRLSEIIPANACVDMKKLNVYELTDGTVRPLDYVDGILTDDNFLNNLLGETNDLFNNLLDIEELCQV